MDNTKTKKVNVEKLEQSKKQKAKALADSKTVKK